MPAPIGGGGILLAINTAVTGRNYTVMPNTARNAARLNDFMKSVVYDNGAGVGVSDWTFYYNTAITWTNALSQGDNPTYPNKEAIIAAGGTTQITPLTPWL